MASQFDDLMAEVGVPALNDHLAEEDIEYLQSDGLQETITAIVDRTPDVIGISSDRGRSPIRVWIAETEKASVEEGQDRIIVDSEKYRLTKIIKRSAGFWDLYFV